MKKNNSNKILIGTMKLVFAALLLALAIVLPMLVGLSSKQLGQTLLPMHIPVMLCGFICGTPFGIIVGLIAPLLKCMVSGMPQLPVAIAMAFELATYGGLCGMLYKSFPQKIGFTYLTLFISMIVGRIINGAVTYLIATVQESKFVFASFLSITFVKGIPGMLVQFALIPLIIIALKKAKLMFNE